ncbi:hypothetical protein ACFFIS_09830 [Virgibacillus soli]|uniref:Uncharacterized protein n=1 Tax=Paracerasibacillus soli TaxID=480284 RepID=A0ABU5CNF6_9BACI|nr:hypothetical protein [Virgibacillus soli]MDY0407426.1 hypothetical protein [Virgibacillus soli]
MSLISYIGCNVKLPEKGYEDNPIDGGIFLGPTYADVDEKAEVKEAQFSTEYVYEVTFDSWGMELTPYQDKDTYEKSKLGLEKVCDMMETYLSVGDYFEFYTCWIGDEYNPREADITLTIRGWYTEGMELREQTLIRFVKSES